MKGKMEEIRDIFEIKGRIRVRALPFETREEWAYWWLPAIVAGKIIRPARMSEQEKERLTVAVESNILTSAGRTQILNYLASNTGNPVAFAQYLAIGNFSINQVQSGDTSVQGEIFRAIPTASNITGTQLDLSTFIGAAQAVGSWTNLGLFGSTASATAGSGVLMTHSLFSYTKGSSFPVTIDYLLTQQ
jgi:predicted RecA/RadA family phage recombinase